MEGGEGREGRERRSVISISREQIVVDMHGLDILA